MSKLLQRSPLMAQYEHEIVAAIEAEPVLNVVHGTCVTVPYYQGVRSRPDFDMDVTIVLTPSRLLRIKTKGTFRLRFDLGVIPLAQILDTGFAASETRDWIVNGIAKTSEFNQLRQEWTIDGGDVETNQLLGDTVSEACAQLSAGNADERRSAMDRLREERGF